MWKGAWSPKAEDAANLALYPAVVPFAHDYVIDAVDKRKPECIL